MLNVVKSNPLGGIYDDSPEAIKRAKYVDLITMPKSVSGTNCFNCKFVRRNRYIGDCIHPQVLQKVNARMCCALWARDGEWRIWEEGKK